MNTIVWIIIIAGAAVFIGGLIAFYKLGRLDDAEHKAKMKVKRPKYRM